MPKVRLHPATPDDLDAITALLGQMADENQEFATAPETMKMAVKKSFSAPEQAHWFLFYSEHNELLGVCYLQGVHNYWRQETRYYLGGFYLLSAHRGKGYFRQIISELKDWAESQNGVQIYTHIHRNNAKSIGAFKATGFDAIDYDLYALHWGDD